MDWQDAAESRSASRPHVKPPNQWVRRLLAINRKAPRGVEVSDARRQILTTPLPARAAVSERTPTERLDVSKAPVRVAVQRGSRLSNPGIGGSTDIGFRGMRADDKWLIQAELSGSTDFQSVRAIRDLWTDGLGNPSYGPRQFRLDGPQGMRASDVLRCRGAGVRSPAARHSLSGRWSRACEPSDEDLLLEIRQDSASLWARRPLIGC